MGEATNINPNLNDKKQFRLNKINEVKDYFIAEVTERKLMSKKLSKHIAFVTIVDLYAGPRYLFSYYQYDLMNYCLLQK